VGNSATTEFSTALGQFLKYQVALQEEQPERILYLEVSQDTYRSFFNLELPIILVELYQVNLIVYDPEIDIKDEKNWIQNDGTEGGVAFDLLERGVDKQDIVLGFHSAFKRQFTEFAVG